MDAVSLTMLVPLSTHEHHPCWCTSLSPHPLPVSGVFHLVHEWYGLPSIQWTSVKIKLIGNLYKVFSLGKFFTPMQLLFAVYLKALSNSSDYIA
jgi:hypothetical protein